MNTQPAYASFGGDRLIASGPLADVLPKLKAWSDEHPELIALTFEEETGRQVDFDLRGSIEEVAGRIVALHQPEPSGPGRPKLGVVAREVTLLPRHWDWLAEQPSGASAALRRLIDEARKESFEKDRSRRAMDATCRFMSAMAGNLVGYESATRALYARDQLLFEGLIASWPDDIRAYALHLGRKAFTP